MMAIYDVKPIGAKNGSGGGYLPLIAPGIAEFETYRAKLEGELRQLIHDAIEEADKAGGNLTMMVHSIADELRASDAPQGFADALYQFHDGR